RLIAILRVQTNQLKWSFSVAFESTSATNESVLKVPLDHGKQAVRVIKSHDREVVCQKAGDASVVKIIEGEPRFHLFGFLMCIAATAARALKSVLQGIFHSSEG
ncbi:unnamed protein product, partial [Brassica oleracea]